MKNVYKVHSRKWKKWSVVAKGVFNRTYAIMKDNPGLFRHPKDPSRSAKFFKTTAWNAAWIAADHVDEMLEEIAEG